MCYWLTFLFRGATVQAQYTSIGDVLSKFITREHRLFLSHLMKQVSPKELLFLIPHCRFLALYISRLHIWNHLNQKGKLCLAFDLYLPELPS